MKANTLTNTWGCDDKCIKFYEDKYIEDVMTLVAGQRETRSFWADVSISSFLANTPCALFILPAFHRFTGKWKWFSSCENVKMWKWFSASKHCHFIFTTFLSEQILSGHFSIFQLQIPPNDIHNVSWINAPRPWKLKVSIENCFLKTSAVKRLFGTIKWKFLWLLSAVTFREISS